MLLGALGFMFLALGFWIPAKAIVAQVLIDKAWQQSLDEGGVVKPWSWMDSWPVGKLVVPRLDVSLVALHGLSGQALAFGPGIEARGGSTDRLLIAGHNDTHFRFLEDLIPGDLIELERQSGRLRFSVSGSSIIDVRDGPVTVDEKAHLLLVTCYPFNVSATNGPLRYVVTATKELSPDPQFRPNQGQFTATGL